MINSQKLEIVRERERELISKPITKKNLVLFLVQKIYNKYQILEDGLY